MRIVRWNHSGDSAVNPEQHNPEELGSVPRPDPATGGLRAGVAEDFPNGGGNRGFLFSVDAPDGRFSWFFQNSASALREMTCTAMIIANCYTRANDDYSGPNAGFTYNLLSES